MAIVRKIRKNIGGTEKTIYPVTVTTAVFDPNTGLSIKDDMTSVKNSTAASARNAEASANEASEIAAQVNTKVAQLQAAMQSLPDGSAVSAQVAVNTADIKELSSTLNGQEKMYERSNFISGFWTGSTYRTDGNYGKVLHTPSILFCNCSVQIDNSILSTAILTMHLWSSDGSYLKRWFQNRTVSSLGTTFDIVGNTITIKKTTIESAAKSLGVAASATHFTLEIANYPNSTYTDIPQSTPINVYNTDEVDQNSVLPRLVNAESNISSINTDIVTLKDAVAIDRLILQKKDLIKGMYYEAYSDYRTDGNYGKVLHTPCTSIQNIKIAVSDDIKDSCIINCKLWDDNDTYIKSWFSNFSFSKLQENGYVRDGYVVFLASDFTLASTSAKKFTIEIAYYPSSVYTDMPSGAEIDIYKTHVSSSKKAVIVVDANGNGDYESLQEALELRTDQGSTGTPMTILLMPGTYVMEKTTSTTRSYWQYRNLSIIGTNKDACIIRNDEGYYDTGTSSTGYADCAPLKLSGNCYIENVTIISTANDSEYEASYNKSYCLHLDFWTIGESRLTVRNCRMVNDHHCCIGIGLHNNYTICIENCDLESTNTSGNGWGTIICHEGSDKGTCKLILRDNIIKDNTNNAITINHPYNGTIDLQFVRNVVVGTSSSITMDSTYHIKDDMCYGNNIAGMNK